MRLRNSIRGLCVAAVIGLVTFIPKPAGADTRTSFSGSWLGNWGTVSWGDGCDLAAPGIDVPNDSVQIRANGYRDGGTLYIFYIQLINNSNYSFSFSGGLLIAGSDDLGDFVVNYPEPLLSGGTLNIPVSRSFPGNRLQMWFHATVSPDGASGGTCGDIVTQADGVSAPSAVGHLYNALGGAVSYLGAPTTLELALSDGGLYRGYANGSIYWHRRTGPNAHSLHGAFQVLFDNLGNTPVLGYPTSEELTAGNGGLYQMFENRTMLWHPDVGAHSIYGAIRDKFWELGNERVLGYPTTEELSAANGGRWQQFQNRLMLWHPNTGAHSVYGTILAEFRALGSEWTVGYPRTEELPAANGGRWQEFEVGRIYWSSSASAHWVHGAILDQFVSLGSEWTLGYPTTEELAAANGGRWQQFQNRLMLWHPNTGAHSVYGAILAKFREVGSEQVLGYPTGEESAWGSGRRQPFQNAWIYWTPTSGAWIEYPCTSGGPC